MHAIYVAKRRFMLRISGNSLILYMDFMDMPVSFFTFPLNLILAVLWFGLMVWLYKERRRFVFVRFMLSPAATFIAVGSFLLLALIVGCTGIREIVTTLPSVLVLLYFQTVLLFVLMRGWRLPTATGDRLGAVRWRFLLNHAGILLAVGSAFWGTPDSETLRIRAIRDVAVKEAYHMDGTGSWLPYEITLHDFIVERYENGVPSMYEALLVVDDKEVMLRVNSPYARSFGEDIYLVGYDSDSVESSQYCVLEIVREPWKYPAVAGVIMMIAGALLLFIGGPARRNEEE